MMQTLRPLILTLWLLTWLRLGASAQIDTGQKRSELSNAIDALLDTASFNQGFQGLFIQSIADGKILYERNAEHVFLPASNNKILTSTAALELLGPDYVYHTRLLATGNLDENGILHGDLILQGSGDPLLSVADLDDIVRQAQTKGLHQVTGRIYFDDTLFDAQHLGDGWAWDDEAYYYSAQISALNLNENGVEIQASPGKRVGSSVQIKITPTPHYTQLIDHAVTGPAKSKPGLLFDRKRGTNVLVVSGNLPIDIDRSSLPSAFITIEEPPRFCAFVMREALQRQHIGISRALPLPITAPPVEPTVLAEHISIPLSALLQRLNKPSDNLIAECLLKTVGAVKSQVGTGGVHGTGEQTARTLFQSIGLDTTELQQADGSGLSRFNYISPHNLVRLLIYLHGSPNFKVFYDSLPIAGIDGTLANRMKSTLAQNNCHAKTGSLSNVSSLSGYVTTGDGQMVAFSILMNNQLAPASTCTAAQNKIVELLAQYKRSP